MYLIKRARPGFGMVEFLLFLGILAIMGTVITRVLISTQEARQRQITIAKVEQQGASLMQGITRRIRRAEGILWPAKNQTGSLLVLQMGDNAEYPTIFSKTASGAFILTEKNLTGSLLSEGTSVQNLWVKNVSGSSAILKFDLVSSWGILSMNNVYRRTFESAVTLFPDDRDDSGGCGVCSAPTCTSHVLRWNVCMNDVCTQAEPTLPC